MAYNQLGDLRTCECKNTVGEVGYNVLERRLMMWMMLVQDLGFG